MKEMVEKILDFEKKLFALLLMENSTKLHKARDIKRDATRLLYESYSLLNKEEKKQRLQLVEGLYLKANSIVKNYLSESAKIGEDEPILVAHEELKSILIKEIRNRNDSYKMLKSPYHYKSLLIETFLIPEPVRKKIEESRDVELTTKLEALRRSIVELCVKYS